MQKITLILFICLIALSPSYGQGLDEDNMVLYAKANILFETGRYDEAVRMYNRILANDEDHTNSLFMRAKAKYELGAYKGTKNDVLIFIDKAGVTKKLIKLMAMTEMRLSNVVAAKNYSDTSIELDPYDSDALLIAGDVALESGKRSEACEYFANAVLLGNARASNRLNEYCNGKNPQKSILTKEKAIEEHTDKTEEDTNTEEIKKDGGIVSLEDIVNEAEKSTNKETIPSYDKNAVQEIEVDDKLTIAITDGIGHRTVQSKPSIFMLSDQDGTVVIDVCINDKGEVTEAIFNRDDSTIFRSSLTSLALRKTKNFVFSKSNAREECGVMVFYIKS